MTEVITSKTKSVITSDMEGRIETFNEAAERIFGYKAEDMIGKVRVSLFSPGRTVLQYVPAWLKTASIEGEFVGKTVFIDREGNPIPAKIRITPTFKDGVQVGFCGVTEVLKDVKPEEVAPNISLMTKIFSWLVITRAPFLTAVMVPILIAAAWVATQGGLETFPAGLFWLTFFGGIFLHVAANTFNDYFDWKSGTDQGNNDYFLPYTGGSRSIELGLITEKGLFRVASVALLLSGAIGVYLASVSGNGIYAFGLFGAFSAYFYTAPPLRLVARRGIGELLIGLNFGPVATAGAVYALTGTLSTEAFLVGIPIGLLTTAILWINQFPDEASDKAAGKINLVVALGKEQARYGYLALMLAAFGLVTYWAVSGVFPLGALLFLGGLPLAISASRVLMREYAERTLVRANVATIKLQFVAGALMAAGLLWSDSILGVLGL